LLKILKFLFAIIALVFSMYALITDSYTLFPFALLFLGGMLLVMGISEFQEKRMGNAILVIFASAFIIFVSIYTL